MTKKWLSEIFADENRKIICRKGQIEKIFDEVLKIFPKQGGNLKRGKCIIASGGMDAPGINNLTFGNIFLGINNVTFGNMYFLVLTTLHLAIYFLVLTTVHLAIYFLVLTTLYIWQYISWY